MVIVINNEVEMNLQPATGTSPQGFVLFSTAAAAQAAVQLLHDRQFDTDCHLRCEMAHKNMYIKEDPTIRRADGRRPGLSPAGPGVLSSMSPHTMAPGMGLVPLAQAYGAAAPGGAVGLTGAFGGPLLASSLAALRPTAALHAAGGAAGGTLLPPPGSAGAMAAQRAGLVGAAPVAGFGPVTNRFDNPPCNTLFVGNLGDGVDEKELTKLFSCQPGFKQIKLLRQPRQVSCFVEFTDTASAMAVHSTLQGALLPSSDRGPIRLQFSKNPYGKRSQYGGGGAGGAGGLYGVGPAGAQSAALFDAAAAGGPGTGMVPASMASALMAASAGADFSGWPAPFNMQ
ncbi:hypothetical protein GPECTOR_42g797 [Gonium pectorale]|uniref:RRM domain-containing protein n=1 Tax=Gonium pectorale TaxID=33097 RepID=A0A150G9Q8_GONPE|nr:hypothetical protein GPECTOR_42g797 [Gonium pectorale]|eukprot:KXZ46586.1 hypothetical protein GPECTOR_42g797 [Gonium pectorale]